MLKNCVFNTSVDTKKWINASAIRAVKTMAQTAVATINNLSEPVVKTASKTMKVTYTITEA